MGIAWIVGGKGTGQSTETTFAGGAYDDALTTWADAQGVNGAALDTPVSLTIQDDGGFVQIYKTNAFLNTVDGVYADIAFNSVYTPDRYKITSHTADTVTLGELAYEGVGTGVDSMKVGGGLGTTNGPNAWLTDGLQLALYNSVAVSGDTIKVVVGTYRFTEEVLLDTYTGGDNSHVIVEGVDSINGARLGRGDTRPVFISIAEPNINSLVNASGSIDCYYWHGIDWHADSKANYCFYNNDGNTDYYGFFNCRFHHADINGVSGYIDGCNFYDCEFDNNVSRGLDMASTWIRVEHCSFHDNGSDGIRVNRIANVVIKCKSYGNGGYGIRGFNSQVQQVAF